MKPLEIQEAVHSAKYPVPSDNAHPRTASPKQTMHFYLTSPTTKKETQHLVGLLGFWRQYTFYTRDYFSGPCSK